MKISALGLSLVLMISASAVLTACSSSNDNSAVGGETQTSSEVWAPNLIGTEEAKSVVELKVGETAYLNELPSAGAPFEIVSDSPEVVSPLPATDDTTTSTTLPDPGIEARSVGTAKIEVFPTSGGQRSETAILEFTVKVTE